MPLSIEQLEKGYQGSLKPPTMPSIDELEAGYQSIQPEEGALKTFGKGIVAGTLGAAESIGSGLEYAGKRLGSEFIADVGKETADYWHQRAEGFRPDESISGKNVIDNPELLADATWWAYNVGNMIPSLGIALIPGAGAQRYVSLAGKALKWSPAVVARLARIGGAVFGGAAGGALEASNTYQTVKEQGGSEEEAARSAEAMFAITGTLNALSVGKILSKAGNSFKAKVVKNLGAASWEGITEGLEEPGEVFAKVFGKYASGEKIPDNISGLLVESLKDAASVAPIAAITGGGASVMAGTESAREPTLTPGDLEAQRKSTLASIQDQYAQGNLTTDNLLEIKNDPGFQALGLDDELNEMIIDSKASEPMVAKEEAPLDLTDVIGREFARKPTEGAEIEGKPVTKEEEMIIKPSEPDFLEKAKVRVGGKLGVEEKVPQELIKEKAREYGEKMTEAERLALKKEISQPRGAEEAEVAKGAEIADQLGIEYNGYWEDIDKHLWTDTVKGKESSFATKTLDMSEVKARLEKTRRGYEEEPSPVTPEAIQREPIEKAKAKTLKQEEGRAVAGMDEAISQANEEGWDIKDGNDLLDALTSKRKRATFVESDEYINQQVADEIERLKNDRESEEEISQAVQSGETEGETEADDGIVEQISREEGERPQDVQKRIDGWGDFFDKKRKEEFKLTPEEPTPYEKAAQLEKEGVVKRPPKDVSQKAKFPEEGIKTVPGKQKGLFGLEKEETLDLFEQEEEKLPSKPKKLTKPDKRPKQFRNLADRMQKQIDEKLNPAIGEQNLTARRARIAASMRADGEFLQKIQAILRRMAGALEEGSLPESLDQIKSKAQIQYILTRKKFSYPYFHKKYLKDLKEAAKGVRGLANEREILNQLWPTREWSIDLRTEKEIKAVEKVLSKGKDFTGKPYVKGDIADGKRLLAAGIDSQEKFDETKQALREYIEPPSEAELKKKKLKKLEAGLIGMKIPGFFPTPKPVAEKMVNASDIQRGMTILEPSAGKGDLADIIKEKSGIAPDLMEVSSTFAEILDAKGYENLKQQDFLEYAGKQYDRIIQNPPYEKLQDIDHVKHAYELLKPGGRVVSLMGEGPFFRNDKKATEFREWLDEVAGKSEKLPAKSFQGKESFRQTGVAVRMVIIDKPKRNVLIDTIKDEKGFIEIGSPTYGKILDVAKQVYSQGHTKFSDFSKQMKKIFAEVWDKIKRLMIKLFSDAKKYIKSEAGAIEIEKKGEEAKPFDAKAFLESIPEYKQFQEALKDPSTERVISEAFDNMNYFKKRFGKGYVDKDMKLMKRIFTLPYWAGKEFKHIGNAVDIEIQLAEKRSSIVFKDYNETKLGEIQQTLPKNKKAFKQFKDLVWKMDGKRFSKTDVPTDWHKEIKPGEDIETNPEHYTQVQKYLEKKGYDPEAIEAFVEIRKLLDAKYVDLDKLMRIQNAEPTLIEEFRKQYGKLHNYFPHRRTGNAYVQVIDLKTHTVAYREHYWSKKDRLLPIKKKAYARAKKWAIENGLKEYRIKQGDVKNIPDEAFYQIKVEDMQQLVAAAGKKLQEYRAQHEAERLMNKEGRSKEEALALAKKRMSADMEVAISHALADVFKVRGWGRHGVRRKNIPGHETEDVFGILFDYFNGYAGFKTKIERARFHSNNLMDLDAQERPKEYEYLSKYAKDVLANSDRIDQVVDGVRALFFVKYLGFVPKSGMINLTQNVILGAPILSLHTKGSHFKLSRAMVDVRKALASKEALTGKEVKYKHLKGIEQKALHDMIETGTTMDLYLREIKGHIPRAGWGKYANKFIEKSGIFMMLAEKFNRASMGLASFRVAYNEGATLKDGTKTKGNYEASVEWAKKRVYDAHFLYGKANYPELMRGNVTGKIMRAGYTFRTFTHNYLLCMANLLTKQGPEGKKAFARSLRNLFLMGGLTSLPFFKAMSELLTWVLGDDDKDPLTVARGYMPYDWTKDFIVYGLPGVMGFDLTGSLSIEVPRNWSDILGVPYAGWEDSVNMVKSLQSGQIYRAISETPITPIMARNAMRGLELYTKGQVSRSGKAINYLDQMGPKKIKGREAIGKSVLGLQPISVSKGYAAYKATEKMRQAIQRKQSNWASQYVHAVRAKDEEKQKKILKAIDKWNEESRKQQEYHKLINIKDAVQRRLQPGYKSVPKKLRQEALKISEQWK